MQEIFNVGPRLFGACTANYLSDLFKPGSIPNQITTNVVPEPRSIFLLPGGLLGFAWMWVQLRPRRIFA
jgi:hypothetical protein